LTGLQSAEIFELADSVLNGETRVTFFGSSRLQRSLRLLILSLTLASKSSGLAGHIMGENYE
jgi:hypothetical protein